MWLSKAHEDSQRASNHQPSPSGRSQASVRLKKGFPKKVRLRKRPEFRKVQKEGKRLLGKFLIFQTLSENFNHPRLGITVSKHFGSAVARNLYKRRIREVFRSLKDRLPSGLTIHVSPQQGKTMPTVNDIAADFAFLIS